MLQGAQMSDKELAKIMLFQMYANTNKPLQVMVLAMASVQKNRGKTSWFGKDKGLAAFEKFVQTIPAVVKGLVNDEIIQTNEPPLQVVREIEEALRTFQTVFPNWQDAYEFSNQFFGERNHQMAIDTLRQLGFRGSSTA